MSACVLSRPPLTPMTTLGCADGLEPLLEARDLDVVGLVAVERETLLVVGHEGEAVDLAEQADVVGRRVELELDGAEAVGASGEGAPVVVEGALALALLAQQVEVDVGDGGPRTLGEALALGEQRAVLVDHRHAVPRQVGRALALARGGIEVGGEAAGRRAAREQVAVLGARDGDRRAGDVGEDRRAGEGRLVARRHRHPHVLAHLDVQDEAGHVGGAEEQVGAERHPVAGDVDRLAALVVAGGEVTPLVELAVGRQVGLRGDPDDGAGVDDDARSCRAASPSRAALRRRRPVAGRRWPRRSERWRRRPRRGAGPAARGRRWRTPTGPSSGKIASATPSSCELAHLGDDRVGVALRVDSDDRQRAGGDAGETLGVGAVEVHGPSQAHEWCDGRLAT